MEGNNLLQASLLGSPTFTSDGETFAPSSRKVLALLSYLALQQHAVSREHLAELLWGAGKLNNVRQALYELRQLPGADDWLRDEADAVEVRGQCDASQFEASLAEEDYAAAVEHYQDALLDGLKVNAAAFSDWLELERARLAQRYSEAQTGYLATLEAQARYGDALVFARQLLQGDLLNETIHRAVMRLEWRRGNAEAALEQFERCREILRDELGVEPLPETLALLAEIEQGGDTRGKQAQLIKQGDDVPSLPGELFGREATLREVLGLLEQNQSALLHGFGGAGKTALASQVILEYLKQKTENKVLWLELGNEAPDAAFDALAKPFDAAQTLAQANAEEKPAVIKTLLADNGITLLVLDDVWNAYTLSKLGEALPAGLPLLVTSRQRYPRLKRLSVGRLERAASVALLAHHAEATPEDAVLEDKFQSEAARLCDLLGDHAFAVRIAGITLKTEQTTPAALTGRIERAPHLLSLPEEFRGEGRESIASLLQVSLDALDDQAFEAFLAFGGLFTPSATPQLMALALRRDAEKVEDALFRLLERGLAERVAKPGSDALAFRVHDLAHSYARLRSPLRPRTVVRAAKEVAWQSKRAFDTLELELGNLLGAAEVADDKDLTALMDALVVGDAYYQARGHSPRSLELLVKAVNTAKSIGELETAHYLAGRLGDTYRELLGDFEKAQGAYEESLELARKIENTHREAIMLSLIGIARFQQEDEDAERYFDEAYELAKCHEDDLALSRILQHRGFTAFFREDWEAMYHYSQEAVATAKRMVDQPKVRLNDANTSLYFGYLNLGEAAYRMQNLDQALEARIEALEFAKENNNQIWEAHALQELAILHHETQKPDLAQAHYLRALELYKSNNVSKQVEQVTQVMGEQGYSS